MKNTPTCPKKDRNCDASVEQRLEEVGPEQWFHRFGVADPVVAAQKWAKWIAKNTRQSESTKHKKVLELGIGRTPSTVNHYLSGDPLRFSKIGPWTLRCLDAMSEALGYEPPAGRRPQLESESTGGKRVALFTDLWELPSPPFHLEIVRRIAQAGWHHHYCVSVHEPCKGDLDSAVRRVLHVFRPDAVIMLRLTPTRKALSILADYSMPTILVHADRYRYPCPPVVANIVPNQETIQPQLWKWAMALLGQPRSKSHAGRRRTERPVIVAMPHEQPARRFKRIEDIAPSIRNERIDLIMETLAAFRPALVEVMDYSFRHAGHVLEKHPDAPAYVCLCDQIAAGIKHLAAASGNDYSERIVGFDDSELARRERIPSFGQHLEEIGELAVSRLSEWFGNQEDAKVTWPEFEMIETKVRLASRKR